jgi:hypothetical protein
MISVYFAEKHMNTFDLLPLLESSEFHSHWSCDLCYSQSYEVSCFDFKTIIATSSQYRRVCSECLNTKNFEDIFKEESYEIKGIISNHFKYLNEV